MYINSAKQGQNEWWRYLLSFIIISIATLIIGNIPIVILAYSKSPSIEILQKFLETMNFSLIGVNTNVGLVFVFFVFVIGFFSIFISIKFIHKRAFLTILTAYKKFRWNRLFYAIFLFLILTIIVEIISWKIDPDNFEINAHFQQILPLILIGFLLLPFQTSFEEILLRGYAMQSIGLLTGKRWIPLLITAIIFGLLHYKNPEFKAFGFGKSLLYFSLSGLAFGLVVMLDDGLEMVLGIHFITNFYAMTLVTYSDSVLSTPALFKIKKYDIDFAIISFVFTMVVFLLLSGYIFKWKKWKLIFKNIDCME